MRFLSGDSRRLRRHTGGRVKGLECIAAKSSDNRLGLFWTHACQVAAEEGSGPVCSEGLFRSHGHFDSTLLAGFVSAGRRRDQRLRGRCSAPLKV